MKEMILKSLIVYCRASILSVVIGLREQFAVNALKCRSHDKHHKTSCNLGIGLSVTLFCKVAISWVVIGLSEDLSVSVALMISTIRLVGNDDLEACDSILQIGHLLGCNGVN